MLSLLHGRLLIVPVFQPTCHRQYIRRAILIIKPASSGGNSINKALSAPKAGKPAVS